MAVSVAHLCSWRPSTRRSPSTRLTAWELRGERYVEVADVTGDQSFDSPVPFAVRVTPGLLV
jgi:hypothetical protein